MSVPLKWAMLLRLFASIINLLSMHCQVWSNNWRCLHDGARQVGPFALTGESCETGGDGGGTGETGGSGNTASGATDTGGGSTGGGTTGGGSTGGSGVVDTSGASCGTGTGCTFNPKGYYQTASNPADYGLQQIHGVLNSLTTVTTFSSNAANSTLSAISTSLNSFLMHTRII